ncbi:fumarylacetoacetate hydrolase family protein [Halococcus thailandensis]|uniref:2-hydroxyhepta-2,4-diene-1,7-dioate isomerase n=1 Tax=Halococcus thailandensis JCM 13552 TaxID=1227457 RepID=M0N2X2_9EURY|nr:fumarylacetoacetate hydrolase family protein [Halococcus thailandensis]EMA51464.1 2-hydroxyhepta-2,4-diene-1,7-dioate isomerase [Halococcus thailandensis JCM 13552]
MHRVRFRDPNGDVRTGSWDAAENRITASAGPGGRLSVSDDSYTPAEVDVLAPTDPSKIVCVGLNYRGHAEEQDKEIPDRPLLFLKGPNTVASHNQTVELLPDKERIDYEAELGVVIDTQCRNVAEADAMDVVRGFTCVDDISNRDDQRAEQNWVRGKAFDDAAPMGPLLASPDEVPDDATIELRVNGERRQHSSREEFIFSIPELVAEITTYMTLEPGDVISTGTPAGVGPLADGDQVAIEIEGIGTLSHSVTIP